MKKFNCGYSKFVCDIVIGYNSWIYAYVLETKQESTVYVFQYESNPTKSDHDAFVLLEEHKTVRSDWNISICLSEVVEEWR